MSKGFLKATYPALFILAFFGLLLLPLRDWSFDPRSIGDSFYGRQRLIATIANFRILIGDRVFPKVLFGKDRWLVYTAENSIDDYQNTIPFSEDQLAEIQRDLDAVNARFAQQGITLLVVVVPDKNTIYPEYIPDEIPVIGGRSRLDQLILYLDQHGKTRILDLRPALLAAKKERQVYYATDTHWNDDGAFIAYQVIISALARTHPELTARPESDYKLVAPSEESLDLAKNIGATILREKVVKLRPNFDSQTSFKNLILERRGIMFSYNPDANLPKAVVYHDSFFFRVIPLLSEHFHRAIYVQHYLVKSLWSLSWVDEEKPDIVIIEFAERYIQDLPLLLAP